jgi:aquaporin Z
MTIKQSLMRQMLAESFGTFLIVLFGCGSAVLAGDKIGFLGISFAFGLAVIAGAYSVGGISGGHFNPAVTLAMCLRGRTEWSRFIPYMLSQVVGAIVASLILLSVASGKAGYLVGEIGLGQNGFGSKSPLGYGLVSGILFEVIFTAIFVMVILGVTQKANDWAGWVIGMTLTMIHIVGIPVTGVSVNPARSIGPALFAGAGALSQLWMFILAPMVGALLGAVLWGVFTDGKKVSIPEMADLDLAD